ncbi:type IV secretion system protein [Cysteiniphilum sp. 6C5]|uniref:type IV secretion system protein n=1 Tax=unclassified Cysteiniphilum TaxID=2610889 RepID=UPI003F82D33C
MSEQSKNTYGSFASFTSKSQDARQAGQTGQNAATGEHKKSIEGSSTSSGNQAQMGEMMRMLNSGRQESVKRLWTTVWILAVFSFVLLIASVMLYMTPKVYPVIVKVNGNNQILSIERAAQIDPRSITPEMHTYLIEQFVKNARQVSFDGHLQQDMIKSAYAYLQGAATQALEDFYQKRDPFKVAATETISVVINSVTPAVGGSPTSTQVRWSEITKDTQTGKVIANNQYTGVFTYKQNDEPPQGQDIALYNPMGFYITHISWSKDYRPDNQSTQ